MGKSSCFLHCLLAVIFLTTKTYAGGFRLDDDSFEDSDFTCALFLPKGELGSEKCITHDSFDKAVSLASERIPLNFGRTNRTDEVIETLGIFVVETTKILASQYRLPRDAIFEHLPSLDVTESEIYDHCPEFLKYPKCQMKRYREFNGMCNNMENPHWGAAQTSIKRVLPPKYANGISMPRVSKSGGSLPSPRLVSSVIHRDVQVFDNSLSTFFTAWGQAVAHDVSSIADARDKTGKRPRCCGVSKAKRHYSCYPISIPSEDPFYSRFSHSCMDFTRSAPSLTAECRLGPYVQRNSITSFLDGSFIYGSSREVARKLRAKSGGLLRSFSLPGDLKVLLPVEDFENCTITRSGKGCNFVAGDSRVNQQPAIAIIHTILMREHNRIASELSSLRPEWDDEQLFQETRLVVSAIIQHITYSEFLPLVLGNDLMEKYDLFVRREGFFDGYDPEIDATMSTAFVVSGLRFGHSLIPPTIERWRPNHEFLSSTHLWQLLLKTDHLLEPGETDFHISGLLNQPTYAMDGFITREVTQHLFRRPGTKFGSDLAAINMHRGRENGQRPYNDYRELCGLRRAADWEDLRDSFPSDILQQYEEIYESPDDVDLWSAGLWEKPLPGALVGPVISCIIGRTFSDLRRGDRFWFENPKFPNSFTHAQLNEIRKVTLSRIVCDNSDEIKLVQKFPLLLPHPETNPRIPCGDLPRIDFSKWDF